jgi:hypothetical protein
VDQDKSGFRVTTSAELIKYTLRLIENPGLQMKISQNAFVRSKRFNRERFEREVKEYFTGLLDQYKGRNQ